MLALLFMIYSMCVDNLSERILGLYHGHGQL
jgi:hypothetical protein